MNYIDGVERGGICGGVWRDFWVHQAWESWHKAGVFSCIAEQFGASAFFAAFLRVAGDCDVLQFHFCWVNWLFPDLVVVNQMQPYFF